MPSITNLNTFNNKEYSTKASSLKRFLWFVMGRIMINSYLPIPLIIKILTLKIFGAKLGKSIVIKPKVNIKYPWLLSIGDYSWIGEKVWIDNLVQVNIAANCCLSQGAMLLTGNHNYKKSSFDLITGEIQIEDGAWIGAQAIVCPGVNIANHSILTVASIATKDTEAYAIYQGNPAVKIKEREILD